MLKPQSPIKKKRMGTSLTELMPYNSSARVITTMVVAINKNKKMNKKKQSK